MGASSWRGGGHPFSTSAKPISLGIKSTTANAKRYTAARRNIQRNLDAKFVFAESKRQTRRAHLILEDGFKGKRRTKSVTAFASQLVTLYALPIQRRSGRVRLAGEKEHWQAGAGYSPSSTIPIK